MKKTRFSAEQIIAVPLEQAGGMKTADVCRKHGISSATLYAQKAMRPAGRSHHATVGKVALLAL